MRIPVAVGIFRGRHYGNTVRKEMARKQTKMIETRDRISLSPGMSQRVQ